MTPDERAGIALYLQNGGNPLHLPKITLYTLWQEAVQGCLAYKTVLEAIAEIHPYHLQSTPGIARAALQDIEGRGC